jgi:hypothetical protein
MELVLLVPIISVLGAYLVYRESLDVAYQRWRTELDFFQQRFAAYEQLKGAVEPIRASGSVSRADIDRFAQSMADMRFLFDRGLEGYVERIYGVLLKKHALDDLIEKAAGQDKSATDQALIEQALSKSRELTSLITNGIYRDMPQQLEKSMRSRPLPPPVFAATRSNPIPRSTS